MKGNSMLMAVAFVGVTYGMLGEEEPATAQLLVTHRIPAALAL